MSAPFHNRRYPVEAFPHLVKDALLEVSSVVQAPTSLIALSIISAMSAVVQRVADVRLPIGSTRPTSLYMCCFAGSGDGKTTIDELISSPISEHDKGQERQFAEYLDNFEKAIVRWKLKQTALMKRMSKLAENGASTAMIEQKLDELDATKPELPRLRRIIGQDFTYAGLMAYLAGDGEAVFINASEGGVVLQSDLFRQHFTKLSMIWGGESILTDRAADSRAATNPRCTLSVMVQDEMWEKYMARHGDALRGSGFLARCLVFVPCQWSAIV